MIIELDVALSPFHMDIANIGVHVQAFRPHTVHNFTETYKYSHTSTSMRVSH